MKNIIIYIFILIYVFDVKVFGFEETKLSIPQMHEDIDYYFGKIKIWENNPHNPYSLLDTDSLKEEIKLRCIEPCAADEFYFLLAQTNKYFDGHTKILESKSPGWKGEKFPWVNFMDGKIYMDSYNIYSINDIPAIRIWEEADKMVTWEYGEKKRQKEINIYFNLLLKEYYRIAPPYRCKLIDQFTGQTTDSVISSITSDTWIKEYYSFRNEKHSLPVDFEYYVVDSIAVLYYNDSDMPNDKCIHNIENFFQQIEKEKIKYLFIDVSQNRGGSDLTHNYIYSYLNGKSYDEKVTFETIFNTPLEWYGWLINSLKSLYNLNNSEIDDLLASNEEFNILKTAILKGENNYKVSHPENKEGFAGNVFVLMDWTTYSSGYDFCEGIKKGQMGTLVGGIPGQRSPYAANQWYDSLPHSKLQFCYSTTFNITEPVITNDIGFLEPDIPYPMDHPLGLEDYKKIIGIVGQER